MFSVHVAMLFCLLEPLIVLQSAILLSSSLCFVTSERNEFRPNFFALKWANSAKSGIPSSSKENRTETSQHKEHKENPKEKEKASTAFLVKRKCLFEKMFAKKKATLFKERRPLSPLTVRSEALRLELMESIRASDPARIRAAVNRGEEKRRETAKMEKK